MSRVCYVSKFGHVLQYKQGRVMPEKEADYVVELFRISFGINAFKVPV